MGMDFVFWKYKKGIAHNDNKIYELACCDGQTAEELEILPIDKILNKVADVFSDWTKVQTHTYEKEDNGAFEIFTTAQIVRFDCYGMQESSINTLIDILLDFGCPLYDPQISQRFDSWTEK